MLGAAVAAMLGALPAPGLRDRGGWNPRSAAAQELPGVGSARPETLATKPPAVETARPWTPFGDLRLRGDFVRDVPGRQEDLRRFLSFLRAGIAWTPAVWLEVGVAGKAALGSDSNRDNRRNNDNEASDSLCLDRAYLRWLPSARLAIAAGQTELPLRLTPMLWDEDLRPLGISCTLRLPVRDFDLLRFAGGYFAGNHLYGDESRLGAAQLGWLWREGAAKSGEAMLGFLHFEHLGVLARQGLARTNRRSGGTLSSDYRLLDAQLAARTAFGGVPLEARLDVARNLGASDERDAARATLAAGALHGPGRVEAGYAYQRLQRDAVLAAFNSDDWWFHSWSRGHLAWLGAGVTPAVSARASLFVEQRDEVDSWTKRLLLDLHWHF